MWLFAATLPSHLGPFLRERNAVSWGCQSVLAVNEVGNTASACLVRALGVSFPEEQRWGFMFGPCGGYFYSSALPLSHAAAPGGRAGWQEGAWVIQLDALLLPWHGVTEHPWCTRLLLKYWLGKTSARQLSGAFATGTEQTGAWRSCVPPRQGDSAATTLLLNLPCA